MKPDGWSIYVGGFLLGFGLVLGLGMSCAARTTGIDTSDKTDTDVTGPTGDVAAEGESQVWQFTTGNISFAGCWVLVPLLAGYMLVARRRRQAVDRVVERIERCEPLEVDDWRLSLKRHLLFLGGPSSERQDAPGRVIHASVKRQGFCKTVAQ